MKPESDWVYMVPIRPLGTSKTPPRHASRYLLPAPNPPCIDALHTSLQAAHGAVEAGRIREAKLRDELAASHQKTMEETIKRLEAEKVAIEAANEALRVTANAANAAKDAADRGGRGFGG